MLAGPLFTAGYEFVGYYEWAMAFLALGGAVSVVVTAIAQRSRLQERRIVLGVALLFTAGGVGLGLAEAWLCVPALVLIGLAGFWVGRQVGKGDGA
jgi:uncharacterized ion transporter superfamily protein YfcC